MASFIFCVLLLLGLWIAWRVVWWSWPQKSTFVVCCVKDSGVYGWTGVVLIDGDEHVIFKQNSLWRFKRTGVVLSEDQQEELNCAVLQYKLT